MPQVAIILRTMPNSTSGPILGKSGAGEDEGEDEAVVSQLNQAMGAHQQMRGMSNKMTYLPRRFCR
jgi:hypothetical protein